MNDLQPQPAPPFEYSLFDENDPHALINMVPAVAREAFLTARRKRPELMGLDERELKARLKEEEISPNATDNRIRLKFWMEYDVAREKGRNLHITYAFAGICTNEFFYKKYLTSPTRVAWLLCVPTTYSAISEEALHFGLEQLRDILETPHLFPDGKPNTKLMEIKAKIVHMLDLRVRGALVQKTLNLNLNAGERKAGEIAEIDSMEELERRMIELKRRERKAQNFTDTAIKEVTEVGEFTD